MFTETRVYNNVSFSLLKENVSAFLNTDKIYMNHFQSGIAKVFLLFKYNSKSVMQFELYGIFCQFYDYSYIFYFLKGM